MDTSSDADSLYDEDYSFDDVEKFHTSSDNSNFSLSCWIWSFSGICLSAISRSLVLVNPEST
jgi:hypothetical protein